MSSVSHPIVELDYLQLPVSVTTIGVKIRKDILLEDNAPLPRPEHTNNR